MAVRPLFDHPWNLSAPAAMDLQVQLARQVLIEDCLPSHVASVAGVDVAYEGDSEGGCAFAAAAVVDARTLKILEIATASLEIPNPYIAGLLSFREIPVIALALEKLAIDPSLVVCDAQGIAHPRRFGLACHLGILYGLPTIGCAKKHLFGEADDPGWNKGEFTYLTDGGEVIGTVLRTRTRVKPVYVSPGHRVSVTAAAEWILKLCFQYRLPEPIRMADQATKRMKRQAKDGGQ